MSVSIEEHTETLFTVTFDSTHHILTTVTSTAADVDAWIADILRIHSRRLCLPQANLVVGLDVEWRPNFSRNQDNPIALLQLCVGHHCLVFQILRADVGVPASLSGFLNDARLIFVGVGIEADVEKLLVDWEVGVGVWKDLRVVAEERTGRKEMKQKGLAGIAQELMGVEVKKPKRVQMSRWDLDLLSWDQIMYACVDAFLSFELGRILRAWEF